MVLVTGLFGWGIWKYFWTSIIYLYVWISEYVCENDIELCKYLHNYVL